MTVERLARHRDDLWQFVRFVVVGVFNTGFSYALYALFLWFGLPFAIANLLSLLIGILVSFKMQGRFVFENQDGRRLLRFAAVWGVIYFINVFLIGRFVALGFNAYVSGAFALPFTVALSYVCQKFIVFRASPRRSDAA